ncbi:HD domain-containing protein [Clostridium sp. B9]|uniref:HD domain-containing protein n=1 Tax=Clostridium sp. B9 TaxID=3423224 RepID=UPI003D2EAC1F
MNKKELFLEIQNHLLNDNKPSRFLNQLKNEDRFKNSPFNIFNQLNEENKSNYSNPWTHTLNVVDIASKYKHLSNNSTAFMWAAFFHDIGKVRTLNPIHDRIGGEITRRILRDCSEDEILNEYIIALVKHHSAPIFVLNRISYSIIDLINTTDIHDVALLSLCNKIGDFPSEENNIERILLDSNKFLQVMSSKTCVTFKDIII